jgi:hypothetical protein
MRVVLDSLLILRVVVSKMRSNEDFERQTVLSTQAIYRGILQAKDELLLHFCFFRHACTHLYTNT